VAAGTLLKKAPTLETVACPLCGAGDFTVRWRGRDRLMGVPGEYQVAACNQCGFLYENPRPRERDIFLIYPPDYPAYHPADAAGHKLLRGGGFKARVHRAILARKLGYAHLDEGPSALATLAAPFFRRRVEKLVFPFMGKGRMLDVGCSSGARMTSMKALGWEVSGIEFSEEVARIARKEHERVFAGDILAAPFPGHSFDLVTCYHVLEHVTNPRAVLEKMISWLAPGGRLVLEMPNAASEGARRFGTHWFLLDLPRHFHHFTPATISAMVASCGGQVIRIEHEASAGAWLGSLQYRDDDRLGRPPGTKPPKRKWLKRWLRQVANWHRLMGRGEIMRVVVGRGC
jgi:2-polyprenyl-3-methyl-5-hydroxy-6-metoxy-1,4-benzoquinol methylase